MNNKAIKIGEKKPTIKTELKKKAAEKRRKKNVVTMMVFPLCGCLFAYLFTERETRLLNYHSTWKTHEWNSGKTDCNSFKLTTKDENCDVLKLKFMEIIMHLPYTRILAFTFTFIHLQILLFVFIEAKKI